MDNIINYYEELNINDKIIIVEFDIILKNKTDEIYINNITYNLNEELEYEKRDERIYNINLKLYLGNIFCFIYHYYLTYKNYNKSLFKLIFFNKNGINYILKLTKENNLLKEREYKLCRNYLNNINEILLYYIYDGINKLNIDKIELNNKRFNYLIYKFNKNK